MSTTLMIFPCDFDLKIIGKNTPSFAQEILDIAKKFYPELTTQSMRAQESKKSNYISLNLTVHALEQTTLDALYNALTQHPDIRMVL
jgi:uncharacterized protein